MFSVTNTGICCLPLCTAMVRPMKSGSTVERRDQVLIGRLSLPARAASTFFCRCPSTNGPFERTCHFVTLSVCGGAARSSNSCACSTVR